MHIVIWPCRCPAFVNQKPVTARSHDWANERKLKQDRDYFPGQPWGGWVGGQWFKVDFTVPVGDGSADVEGERNVVNPVSEVNGSD